MRGLYDFVVKPYGERYENTKTIDGKQLILNTRIESHKFVNSLAEVVSTPIAIKTDIKPGDIVVIHRNVFRVFYDIRGEKKNSRSYFGDNLFFVDLEQIYLYGKPGEWKTINDRCFVKPIRNNDKFRTDREQNLIGVLKYGNSSLQALEINKGDLVGYKPYGEYEFIVDGERLYCMKSNDIVLKYEYQGDEVENNYSWTKSS